VDRDGRVIQDSRHWERLVHFWGGGFHVGGGQLVLRRRIVPHFVLGLGLVQVEVEVVAKLRIASYANSLLILTIQN